MLYLCGMEKKEILTIGELIDLLEQGKLEGNHFICYPTKLHRESDSRGYIPREQIEAHSKWREELKQKKWRVIWYGE